MLIQGLAILYRCAHHNITNSEVTMNTLNSGPESSHFILLPYLHRRLWEPEILRGSVPDLFLKKGAEGTSVVGTFWLARDSDVCQSILTWMCDTWLLLEQLIRSYYLVWITNGSGD